MYKPRELIKALETLPDEAELRGWDDGCIYVLIDDHEFTIDKKDYEITANNGPGRYLKYTKGGIIQTVNK